MGDGECTVTRAVDVMRNFYVAFPEYGPITRVHFSGGVFHSAAGVTLASQRFVAMVEACDTLRPRLRMEEDPSKNARSSFGAGCLGALGIVMELRRQATGRTVQTLEYERSDCDVQTLACPRLHARDATTESQWKFEIRGRGGGGVLVKACVGEEVRVPCLSHEGVAFLGITAVKYGGQLLTGQSVDARMEGTVYYYSDEVVERDLCAGFDVLIRTRPLMAEDQDEVLVTCRIDALRRRLVVVVRSDDGEGPSSSSSVHTTPVWITYAFPGCCNQWRAAAKLCRLAHYGMAIHRGLLLHQRITHMTERVLNNSHPEADAGEFVAAMWAFNAWILEDVPVDILHNFCSHDPAREYTTQRLEVDRAGCTLLPTMVLDDMEKTMLLASAAEEEEEEEGAAWKLPSSKRTLGKESERNKGRRKVPKKNGM